MPAPEQLCDVGTCPARPRATRRRCRGRTNLCSLLPISCLFFFGLFSPGFSLHAPGSPLRLACFCLEMGDESEGVCSGPFLSPLAPCPPPQPPAPRAGCRAAPAVSSGPLWGQPAPEALSLRPSSSRRAWGALATPSPRSLTPKLLGSARDGVSRGAPRHRQRSLVSCSCAAMWEAAPL